MTINCESSLCGLRREGFSCKKGGICGGGKKGEGFVEHVYQTTSSTCSCTAVFRLVVQKSRRESAHVRPFGGDFELKILRVRGFSLRSLDNQLENCCKKGEGTSSTCSCKKGEG